jgi:predicted dehydrogenase
VDPLRAAVIGLGIGRRHVQAYQGLPGVEVAAIADVDEQALAKARQEFGIRSTFTDYRQAFARSDIDLVSICTPDRLHAEQALFALEAGKHVLCEKPMATSLEDAAQVVRKAKETGLKFMACHNYRFIPQFARVKELVASGMLGDVFYGESSYVQDLYFMEKLGPGYWRLKDPQDFYLGGAVHNVDLLRWIMGEIQEVHSYSTHVMPFYPLDDNYVSNFRFANGRIGRLLLILGACLKDKFYVDLQVYGYEGAMKAVMQRDEVIQNMDRLAGDAPEVLPVQGANSHAAAIAHFVQCVREDRQPLVDAVEGARAVAVCVAAIRSAQEKRPVTVDYFL